MIPCTHLRMRMENVSDGVCGNNATTSTHTMSTGMRLRHAMLLASHQIRQRFLHAHCINTIHAKHSRAHVLGTQLCIKTAGAHRSPPLTCASALGIFGRGLANRHWSSCAGCISRHAAATAPPILARAQPQASPCARGSGTFAEWLSPAE